MVVSGFAHAPVSKGLMLVMGISSVGAALFQWQPYTHVQLAPHLLVHHQWYRLALQHLAFVNSSQLFLALLIVYQAGRQVERTLGSHRYASFLLSTVLLFTCAQMALLVGVHMIARRPGKAPAGPWALVFAIVHQHARIIPDRWTVQIGYSIYVGNNTISTYSIAVLLAFSQPESTPWVALLAILCSMYSSGRPYRIPSRIYRLLSMALRPWIGTTKLPARSWRAQAPQRRSYAARQARSAQHTESMQSIRTQGSLAVPQLATFLRSRVANTQRPPPPSSPPLLPTTQPPVALP